jgi:hypothetical protein
VVGVVGTTTMQEEATWETGVAKQEREVERRCDMRREWDTHGRR